MSNPDDRGYHIPDPEPERLDTSTKLIRGLWFVAIVLFIVAIRQAANDDSQTIRLVNTGAMAFCLVLSVAVASLAEPSHVLACFAPLALIALTPAVPFALAALGYAFWEGIIAALAVMVCGGLIFMWVHCPPKQQGGVK